MSQPISPRDLAQQWLDITVQRFCENIRRLRIVHTGALLASFRTHVIGAAGADQLRLQLSYALYGKFIDMGVGRGSGAGVRKGDDGYDRIRNNRGQFRRRGHQPRQWYSKEVAHQTHRLAELLLDLYGKVAKVRAADALPGTIEVNL